MVATMESRQGPWPKRVNQDSCGPANLGDVGKRGPSTTPPWAPQGRDPKQGLTPGQGGCEPQR